MKNCYWEQLESFEDWDEQYRAVLGFVGNKDKERVEYAIRIVQKYHDQPRHLYQGNYNRHPLRVARILLEEFGVRDVNTILIALCHDLGEWTDYDVEQLKSEFGAHVYEGVQILTWNKKESWGEFVENIVKNGGAETLKVKIADKLDNNRGIVFSDNIEEQNKAREKTNKIMKPIIKKYYREYWGKFEEILQKLK